MNPAAVILLAGLLVPPAALLWVGHGFRHRSREVRAAFWGGVAGHSLAVALMLTAALLPPVHWDAGFGVRSLLVHGGLLAGGVVGALLGLALVRLFR